VFFLSVSSSIKNRWNYDKVQENKMVSAASDSVGDDVAAASAEETLMVGIGAPSFDSPQQRSVNRIVLFLPHLVLIVSFYFHLLILVFLCFYFLFGLF